MPKMTGHRYFAEAMRGYGVTHLFYVNSIVGPAMVEMDKVGVKRVVAHGEKAAAYMADGYARACRRPGVCLSQDIGTTNLLAGMRDAHMACTPVIAITGGQNDLPRYRHAYQNAEDFRAWETVTKANYSVDTPQRFPDLLRQAFRDATTGTPGPVHLELRGNSGQSLDREAEYDLTFEERFARYPAFRPVADAADVHAAIKALRAAAKPIIVVGGGAVSSDAGPEIIRLAEKLSIPIATSLHARALVPDDHPLNVGVPGSYSRWCANQAIAAADLVFFVGSHTGGQVTNGWQVPRIGSPTIQLDIDARELGRNYPNVVSLVGDAQVTVAKFECHAAAPRAHLQGSRAGAAGAGHAGGGHLPRRDLDGADDAADEARTAVHPLRRIARLGVSRDHRREGGARRSACHRLLWRRRLLLPHAGARNGRALRLEPRHGRQQQPFRRRQRNCPLPLRGRLRQGRTGNGLRGVPRRARGRHPARPPPRARRGQARRRRDPQRSGHSRQAGLGSAGGQRGIAAALRGSRPVRRMTGAASAETR